MEREIPLQILEQKVGKLLLTWDDLYLTARAQARPQGEGLCKLWLTGGEGEVLLGTLIPEGGRLCLCRKLPLDRLRRQGAWPAEGARCALVYPFDPARPFPKPDLFCLARVEGGRLLLDFDRDGTPILPT